MEEKLFFLFVAADKGVRFVKLSAENKCEKSKQREQDQTSELGSCSTEHLDVYAVVSVQEPIGRMHGRSQCPS